MSPLAGRAEILHVDSGKQLHSALKRAEVLLVTDFRSSLIRDAWPAQPATRWVHAASAGIDRLLFPALLQSDITLTNAAGIFDAGIAEYVIGAVLSFAKDVLGSLRLQASHTWQHRDTEMIAGKRLLVIGTGSIGSTIAERAEAMGMRVSGVARSARTQPYFERVHAQADLPTLLPQADYVALAAPLTPATRHMIGRDELRAMKSSARLINVGRGPLVDTQALVHALQSGEIAGAALDVFEQEPLPPEHALWTLPNVLLSAHMSGDFVGWREALSAQFIDNFDRYVRGEALLNVIDKSRQPAPAADDREGET